MTQQELGLNLNTRHTRNAVFLDEMNLAGNQKVANRRSAGRASADAALDLTVSGGSVSCRGNPPAFSWKQSFIEYPQPHTAS